MAELYQAYGSFGDDEELIEKPIHQNRNTPVYDPSVIPVQQPQQPQQSQQQPPVRVQKQEAREHFSQEYPTQYQQQGQHQQQNRRNVSLSYSFWDRMALKRSEVIKLAIFALVIVLAIALDRIGTHYLTKYIADNIFTDFQEFMLRFSYPIIVFLIIWIIKAM